MLSAVIDEGFGFTNNASYESHWNYSPADGADSTLDFESGGEGFGLVNNASYETHWDYSPADGTDTTYSFETTIEGFTVFGDCSSLYTFAEPMDTGGNC